MFSQVGIVIVSYNASLAVRATLASLRQAENKTPYKLLLIDNASELTERTNIRKAFEKHAAGGQLSWKYIQSNKNLGFAGGNNVGIREFLEDPAITHICLLNSDVILSDHWLDRLVAKQVGIVSAVTNKAYSEQCVPVEYTVDLASCLDMENETVAAAAFDTINDFAQNWYRAWRGNLVACEVTFFCVLLTTDLIRKVGFLDEAFFPGGYEDDDYCLRVLASGIEIYLARDTFIHHFGSASFGQLEQQYFNKKASKNREYLENKHHFILKRRPEKPITSYAQDIVFALGGKGDALWQAHFHSQYIETLDKLINHVDTEFSAIYGALAGCAHTVPQPLQELVATARQHGDTGGKWSALLTDIMKGLKVRPCDESFIGMIGEKLKSLSAAVHAKAEANLAMVEFLCRVGVFGTGQPPAGKARLKKLIWLAQKGLPFIWRLRGIVFFGGYPYAEREKDGYFQRVRSIDALFTDRWRIYVDHYPLPSRQNWYDRPAPGVIVLHMHNHRHMWFMRLLVRLCVLRCRSIYFHSVLRMEDGKFGSLMRWPGLTKVIDIHGVVPEEFRMHNDFYSAGLYDQHEKLAVKKADRIIVVSEAMRRYFMQKYREAAPLSKFIVLPIFPEIHSSREDKPYHKGMPIVVYAGGTHKWQQVPKMVDAIAATKDHCIHKFFCPNPAEALAFFPEDLRNHPHITIDSKPHGELLTVYEECHFGFILREDSIVNHAACPTKLVEYVAKGIIPIVDCEEMGDFKSLGMQFVRLKDFLAGALPGAVKRIAMAEVNYDVYNQLRELNHRGKDALRQALSHHPQRSPAPARRQGLPVDNFSLTRKFKTIVLKFRHQAGLMMPKHSVPGRLLRRVWWTAKGYRKTTGLAQPAVLHLLPPCDVLIQVDNFIVGGLENVVLDQIDTFREAGMQVGLLVLGEAGVGVTRARNKEIPLCVIPYDANTYRKVLSAASPKLIISHYSIQGAGICHEAAIPFIQVIHNTYMWFSNEQAYQFSRAARQTTCFVAVSAFVKDYTVARLGVPADKCLVIPNGIDLTNFKRTDREKERRELRIRHGFSKEDFIFLSVGSINHQKNHICTIRAFHQMLRECPEAKLVILGKLYEKQLWAEIRHYIAAHQLEEHIVYAGDTDHPPAYYAMADAFVHSAFFEGGQLSLLEAMAANLPVVTTEVGFARHFKGRQGFYPVPPPVDIIKYEGSINELVSTPACEQDIAQRMMEVYAERIRPDLPENILGLMDKKYSYQLYVDLVTRILEDPENADITVRPWPDLISEAVSMVFPGIDPGPGKNSFPALPPCDVLFQVDNFMVGGLENAVLDQMHIFRRAGMRVGLLILGEAGIAAELARNSGIDVCVTKYDARIHLALLKETAPRAVISHYSFRGAPICDRLGIPFIQVLQNTYMWFSDEQAGQFTKAAKFTTVFVAVSEYVKTYSVARLGVPAEKCLVIPNCIDLDRFKKMNREKERGNLRKKHGFSEDDFIFLSIGSINHQKNHICTVRAFQMSLQACPRAKLVILGKLYEKKLWAEIQDFIAAHGLERSVIYAGESDNPPSYYAMADAFVHSAFFEGGQLSILEAIAARLPVITTEVGFAIHFKGRRGFALVPPPVDIINYQGKIWELRSTAKCENNIAAQMINVYEKRPKPDIAKEIVDMFDREYTYRLYVDLVRRLPDFNGSAPEEGLSSWPALVSGAKSILLSHEE